MGTHWGWLVFALAAGMALPLQAGINAQLTRHLGHSLHASFASFVIGSIGLFVFGKAIGLPAARWTSVPIGEPWLWVGGLLGAIYVAATIMLAPRLGAATMIGLIVAGQLAASVALDHFGLVGFPTHPASLPRVVGVALIFIGVMLITRN